MKWKGWKRNSLIRLQKIMNTKRIMSQRRIPLSLRLYCNKSISCCVNIWVNKKSIQKAKSFIKNLIKLFILLPRLLKSFNLIWINLTLSIHVLNKTSKPKQYQRFWYHVKNNFKSNFKSLSSTIQRESSIEHLSTGLKRLLIRNFWEIMSLNWLT